MDGLTKLIKDAIANNIVKSSINNEQGILIKSKINNDKK